MSLKNSSPGHDEIPVDIIKMAWESPSFRNCLLQSYNDCIRTGSFPPELKVARVRPIPKKGNDKSLDNMRPISILSSFDKLFERHINDAIVQFIERNNLLYPLQSGFRTGHSCASILAYHTDAVLAAMNKGKITLDVFCDAKKAFDSVSHQILIRKLGHYNFHESAISLIESFLGNRQQFVSCDGIASARVSCHPFGVPQGSILGPSLFILFFNDLAFSLPMVSALLFADDLTLSISNADIESAVLTMNNALSVVNKWFAANRMLLNPSKTKAMLLGTTQRLKMVGNELPLPVSYDGSIIELVSSFTLLGVELDQSLTFKGHASSLIGKLQRSMFFMRLCHRYSVPRFVRELVYNSMINSHIMYGLLVYSGCSNKAFLQRIETMRKQAARLILGKPFDSPSKPLFDELGWLSFENLYKSVLLSHVGMTMKGLSPSYFENLFSPPSHAYRTRFSLDGLVLPREAHVRSVTARSISSWNSLDDKPCLVINPKLKDPASNLRRRIRAFLHNS